MTPGLAERRRADRVPSVPSVGRSDRARGGGEGDRVRGNVGSSRGGALRFVGGARPPPKFKNGADGSPAPPFGSRAAFFFSRIWAPPTWPLGNFFQG